MTATLILESLAKDFSIDPTAVQAVLEMVDAGLSPPFIGRFRRGLTGGLSESHIRRLVHSREALQELDRRRGTILRSLEKGEGIADEVLDPIRRCMDRFELEDLFVPHRRPEPEVQLALDRGLGALADLLVKPVPRAERRATTGGEETESGASPEAGTEAGAADADASEGAATAVEAAPEVGATTDDAASQVAEGTETSESSSPEPETPPSETAPSETAPSETAPSETAPSETAPSGAPVTSEPPPPAGEPAVVEADTTSTAPATPEQDATAAEGSLAAVKPEGGKPEGGKPEGNKHTKSAGAKAAGAKAAGSGDATAHHEHAAMNMASLLARIGIPPELARLCQPFVDPDKGIHTESEALSGAVRILSDRLGRNSHLRTLVRRMMRKRGDLSVRALVDDSKAGKHKGLLKVRQPLRQIQGHRLLAIRQAQKDRVLNTVVHLDPEIALPKVRAALGTHTQPAFEELLTEIARQALEVRLLPVVEADVRLELKERGDHEALRFLSQHLRQILLTPPFGRRPVAGVDVNAKGDWTIAFLDEEGKALAVERVETGEKEAAALGAELAILLDLHRPMLIAAGHGKGPRAGVAKMRAALRAAGREDVVTVTNEAGLSSYANSELARTELPETTVPQRMGISLGRRLQDPLAEILKVEPRHLGLGAEQGLVSKANARRIFRETVESCIAHVGCEVIRAPRMLLERVPGLDDAAVGRILQAREVRPFTNRDDLRAEGLLDEAQWTSAIAFLRIFSPEERLDRTSLHPEQYALARRVLEDAGASVEESLGRPGVTKGLRRVGYDVDEATWRDLMRELSFPGRDPRPRLFVPELMHPDTDSIRLTSDRVVTGVVTNVASFGAFIDLGLKQDAMLHISEIAARYVRDARELLSIGQSVRARIRESGGQRLALSLKDVPRPERRGGGGGAGGGGGTREGRGGRRRGGRPSAPRPTGRGALLGTGRRRGRGRGDGRRGEGERMSREERADLERINATASKEVSYNPFAKFFKSKDDDEDEKS